MGNSSRVFVYCKNSLFWYIRMLPC
uniref:Uncharacterized protein n=1 Tax=Arundo donax TaxID=35708 RepID=A0A0A9H588_ARUDO